MRTVIYYGVDEKGAPTGWTGLVHAETIAKLFWQIDNHIDPYSVLMYEIDHSCSVSFKVPTDINDDAEIECFESEFSGPEFKAFAQDIREIKTDMQKKPLVRFTGRVHNFSLKLERVTPDELNGGKP